MSSSNGASWKSRLYNSYISSEQAAADVKDTADEMFRPRKAFINSIIAKHLPHDRSVRILDLGCGHGAFLYFLSQAGYKNIYGIDISQEQVELAHQLGISEARHGTLEEVLSEEKDGCVDVVLVMDVLEHLIKDDLFHILDEIRRVLKHNGMCIAHVPNAEGLYGMRIRYGDMTHEQAFTPTSARQVFRTIGFSKVACYEDKPVVHGMKSLVRRVIWDTGTFYHRLMLIAETGSPSAVLSQNMLVKAVM
ncbi:MAG TPA: class I SAM-dependent methyltransferase [Pseudacidobacterium sp.]|jgi:2-polyprenyl-3-methyl-5-hydroxy-6-metoxy-1,4-benzoquinol methylase|nr:class I SAM-dependent methyltransferase [Pseudacidobacterium sp.]